MYAPLYPPAGGGAQQTHVLPPPKTSAAIPIIAPPKTPPSSDISPADSPKPQGRTDASTSKPPCRNVSIYGYCKYEDSCPFDHSKKSESGTASKASSVPGSPLRSALSVRNASAAVFVPKSVVAPTSSAPSSQVASTSGYGGWDTAEQAGSPTKQGFAEQFQSVTIADYDYMQQAGQAQQQQAVMSQQPSSQQMTISNPYAAQEAFDEAYYMPQKPVRQALQYHLYAPPLPHVSNLHPHHASAHAFFMSPTTREDLQRRSEAIFSVLPPPLHPHAQSGLPEELHVYHSLVPLDVNFERTARVFGYKSCVYKATCGLDGKAYVLRRIEGFRLMQPEAIGSIEKWRRVRHPGVVSAREAFTTRAFGDNSIVFVYDYHPCSTTLYDEHLTPKPPQMKHGRLQPVNMQIPERIMWSYVTQLGNALRVIHQNGLASRCVEPTKVLVTGKNRVRLNCCGIFDVIAYDGGKNIATHQQDDLFNLGKLLVSLACNSVASVTNLNKSLDYFSRQYSPELKNVALFLLSKPGPVKTADELIRMVGPRALDEFDAAMSRSDLLENELMRELENGRLVRLLCKFGFINERPEFDHDPRWSETGDRYIIKLFRDHVFHQVDEQGNPVVDLSHVLVSLNKLDVGSEEKVMLTSRDEQSCLIVSYREIKNCIEAAFADLSRTSR